MRLNWKFVLSTLVTASPNPHPLQPPPTPAPQLCIAIINMDPAFLKKVAVFLRKVSGFPPDVSISTIRIFGQNQIMQLNRAIVKEMKLMSCDFKANGNVV